MNVAVVPVPIGRVEGCAASRADDLAAVEEALEIRLGNQQDVITTRVTKRRRQHSGPEITLAFYRGVTTASCLGIPSSIDMGTPRC